MPLSLLVMELGLDPPSSPFCQQGLAGPCVLTHTAFSACVARDPFSLALPSTATETPAPSQCPPQGSVESPPKQELHEGVTVQRVIPACSFKENRGPWLEVTLSYEVPRGNETVPSQEAASRQMILSATHTSLSSLAYRSQAACQQLGVGPLRGRVFWGRSGSRVN